MKRADKVYELKVTLQESDPPIWRRLRVRSDVGLSKLHGALQVAMGWTNSHLHQFVARREVYGEPDAGLFESRRDEIKVRLDQVLKKPGDCLVYEYDFGDGWIHDVVLEAVRKPEPGEKYPLVVAGERACPPEDCGGIGGYYHLLDVLRAPEHPEYEDLLDWVGGSFDPEAFHVNAVNRAFHGKRHRPQGEPGRASAASARRSVDVAKGRGERTHRRRAARGKDMGRTRRKSG